MPEAPPEAPRLYLNEHLSPRLAAQLRSHGFDVVSTQEAGLLSATDEEQLAWAVAARRAVVSFNACDFAALHEAYAADGRRHWGIVLSTREPIGTLLHRLLRLLNSLTADDLADDVRWLNEFR